jgi:hypothetical protein
MLNSATIKDQATNVAQWAASGTKLTYAAVGVGAIVGLILFRVFFKGFAGFFHAIGFSVGSGTDPAVAAQPGLSSSSRLKLLLVTVLPPASGYAAYLLFPKWFPTIFQ